MSNVKVGWRSSILICLSLFVCLAIYISTDNCTMVKNKVNINVISETRDQLWDNSESYLVNSLEGEINEEVLDETVVLPRTLEALRRKLKCTDKRYASRQLQRGEFWVLQNYIKADHGDLPCYQHLTYTTHADFTFLGNLEPLVLAWDGPVSVALHAPGYDLSLTVDSIRYLRDCVEAAHLIRKWVSFHIYFHRDHIPKEIPKAAEVLTQSYDCSLPPYDIEQTTKYTANNSLLYPINVGRNIAREAALTHFILASDIELYPSPKLSQQFLNMIARDPLVLVVGGTSPRIFSLPVFELTADHQLPRNKDELVKMLKAKSAVAYHEVYCPKCQRIPKRNQWVEEMYTEQMTVFSAIKRIEEFQKWEPIFIGTSEDPLFEERLSWEGRNDKSTQNYIMCVKDYDYMMLSNAFLIHKPGIKLSSKPSKQDLDKTKAILKKQISKELDLLYGKRKGCVLI